MLGGRSLGSQALPGLPSLQAFFFWQARSQVWEGFLDRSPCGRCLKTHGLGRGCHCSPTQAGAAAWSSGGPTCSSASSPS